VSLADTYGQTFADDDHKLVSIAGQKVFLFKTEHWVERVAQTIIMLGSSFMAPSYHGDHNPAAKP
jgi:hypothetical protein